MPGQQASPGALPDVPPVSDAPVSSQPAGPTTGDAPAIADDGDLIEKDWVVKVKQIVRATADNPYEQNLQFTKLKADYMQKRYGKSIKLD